MASIISFISNLFTIVASGIAIYLFFFKRNSISSVFRLLLNYSFQITLTELKTKLEQLNDLNTNDAADKGEIINKFSELAGQINGNKLLLKNCGEISRKLLRYAGNPSKLTEPIKRSLISELREKIRGIDVQNYDEIIRG
jgi:hypothetical protein